MLCTENQFDSKPLVTINSFGALLVEGGIGRRISRGVPKLSRTTELSKKWREAPESIGFSEW